MKHTIFAGLIALFSVSAHAGEFEMSATPDTPVVITADGRLSGVELKAPWFTSNIRFTNHTVKTVTLTGFEVVVVPTVGEPLTYVDSFDPVKLSYSDSMDRRIYPQVLPYTDKYKYKVTVSALGWVGSEDNPERLEAEPLTFETQ